MFECLFNGFEIMFDCIHVRKTGYQNFRKQLKIAFETRDFCINLGPKLVKIRLRFSRTVAVFSVSVTLVCRNFTRFLHDVKRTSYIKISYEFEFRA